MGAKVYEFYARYDEGAEVCYSDADEATAASALDKRISRDRLKPWQIERVERVVRGANGRIISDTRRDQHCCISHARLREIAKGGAR